MVKIRLIFIKQFAFRRKGRHKQERTKETKSTKKISRLTYSYEIKWSSLLWNGSWGRHADKNALRDDLKNNCNFDHDFVVNYKKKNIHNTHTDTCAFCDINQSLIKSVWNYTKRHPRPFVLILWTSSFTLQVMKILTLLANSHRPVIIVKWFIAFQTNTLNCCFLILTTLPASKRIDCFSYDSIVNGAKS